MKLIQSLILVLLMSTIQSALANPCPADNRYAKKPDGCSSWSNNPQQFRDRWGPVNFRPACMAHDRCYYTLGTSEASCNNAFSRNLLSACRDGLRVCRNVARRRICTPPEPTYFSACSAFAGGMVTLVRAASRSVYRKAQDAQRKHENQCRRNAALQFWWSYAGPLSGKHCVRINEPSAGNDGSTHTWGDNYLCSNRNYGIRWSYAGPIRGMRCTQLHESASPHTWGDNYLCVPSSSQLRFSWSSAEPISGKQCIKVNEPADPHTWNDNYLCY